MINLNIINFHETLGSAIYNSGTLNIINCTFTKNTANYGGVLKVIGSNFVNNTAELWYGGVVYNYGVGVLRLFFVLF
ncbi:hypothetical protein ALNOE001_08640 [Candidatus Methanobinarius endosymbioticus]|uniref:Right handed beta helix domain-containing protein n=1 Tax=Candidatus Methanobinarius endosymbioticus TaxID=2006182 RepID=A0A366MD01_9EURY|nr:hypothetical protein ALNOE001_08640 [Candidatus Methanobinarius endosymbioticus]